jgi:hypothetical protein
MANPNEQRDIMTLTAGCRATAALLRTYDPPLAAAYALLVRALDGSETFAVAVHRVTTLRRRSARLQGARWVSTSTLTQRLLPVLRAVRSQRETPQHR